MNGFSVAATSFSSPPPPNAISEISCPPLPATRPEFSSFRFKKIGQLPTLLSRFSDAGIPSGYHSPSPERSDMDIASSEDPAMMDIDDHHTFHSAPRKSLLDILGGSADQGHRGTTIAQTQDTGVSEPLVVSPTSASSSKFTLPRSESRLNTVSRQLSATVDVPHVNPPSPRKSAVPEPNTYEPSDEDIGDLYAGSASPPQSPLSLFADLSEAVRESAELDRITSLHHLLTAEREELIVRHEETSRALSRTKTQLDRVLSLADEAIQMTTVFVDKEKTRLETKKTKAEAKIERRKNFETEQRRKARELERIRQREEERKAQVEMEQQAERKRVEEQRRKEEALEAERQRQDEIRAQERAQAEEHRRLEEERCRIEEEERQRQAEDRRRREEEERKRQAEEEQRKEEEERLRRQLAERDALARKQEEDRRTQLLERRRLAEEERRRKEAEVAAAKSEAEKQALEKEQQRIFQERRATALKDKYRNHNRPESGVPPTGSPPTPEGMSNPNLPLITVKDTQTDPQGVTEQHPGTAKTHSARDTPTFVPATTEAGRLPPDLAQQFKVSNNLVDHAVKHEATSPVLAPIDNAQPAEGTPPPQPPSRPTLAPVPLLAPSHLPARPVKIYHRQPVPTSSQQRGRSPSRRYPSRRSRSRSRSSTRSPRRGSPISRIPSRTSRSPDSARGRYQSPPAARRGDHYAPPRPPYRGGGSRHDRGDPQLPPLNPRKRTLDDSWVSADTPSKLDYSHPAKRRVVSPLRSKSPPSPRSRPPTHPPTVVAARHQPPPNRRGKGGGPNHLPLEQRLSERPQLPLRDRLG